jgi:hypothetical protein
VKECVKKRESENRENFKGKRKKGRERGLHNAQKIDKRRET